MSLVLNERDSANHVVKLHNRSELPQQFDVDERAQEEGIQATDELLHPDRADLGRKTLMQLAFANYVADELGINRRIMWGGE